VKLLVILLAQAILYAAGPPAPHVRNFGELNDHLYRGGTPSAVGLEELHALGVKVIVDLRSSGEGTDVESQQVHKLGMKYVNVPLGAWSAPTQAQLEQILPYLFRSDTEPVFIHCRRGKDRTGTVLACYRIQHDNWNNRRALAEAESYGISRVERGMRSYILHFTPLSLQTLRAGNQ
jgi:tyrosine-protein phosphatase SIW14